MRRRAVIGSLAAVVSLPLVLVAEVLIARRAESIDGYSAAELDGRIGGGGPALRVVWIGDSTGVGVGATSPDTTLSRVVASSLGRPVDLTVLAVSGATVGDALLEQAPRLAELDPDWVFVGIGNNDVTHATPRGRFEDRFAQLLDRVRKAGPRQVVVLGIAEFAGTPLLWQPLRYVAGRRADQLDSIVARVTRDHEALYVPIKRKTGHRFVDDPQRYHARDGFHPDDEGYALWAEAVAETLSAAGMIPAS